MRINWRPGPRKLGVRAGRKNQRLGISKPLAWQLGRGETNYADARWLGASLANRFS